MTPSDQKETPLKACDMPDEIWANRIFNTRNNGNWSLCYQPRTKCYRKYHRTKYIRADLAPSQVPQEVKQLRSAIAEAAICLLKPNAGISDTIWLDNKCTLYEHLVSYLDVEMTGDVDEDIRLLAILKENGGEG